MDTTSLVTEISIVGELAVSPAYVPHPGEHVAQLADLVFDLDAARLEGKRVALLLVDSVGGPLEAWPGAYHALRTFSEGGGKVVVFVRAVAGSTAALYALGADYIVLHPQAALGLHGAVIRGVPLELESTIRAESDKLMAAVWRGRTGASEKDIARWLAAIDEEEGEILSADRSLDLAYVDAVGSLEDARGLAARLAAGEEVTTGRAITLAKRTAPAMAEVRVAGDEVVRLALAAYEAAAVNGYAQALDAVGDAAVATFLSASRRPGAEFRGYFSKLHNVRRQIWEDAYGDWADAGAVADPGKEAADVFIDRAKLMLGRETAEAVGRTIAMFAVANLLGEVLSGRGPDEDETVPEWILRKMALAPFTTIPLVGSALEQPINAAVSALFHGHAKWRSFSMRASPSAGAVERLLRIIWKMWRRRDGLEYILGALEIYGLKANLPVGSNQVERTARYLLGGLAADDVAAGRWDEAVTGPIYGERKHQTANPVTMFTR